MTSKIITELTDINAIFQAVTLENEKKLNHIIVDDVIESILNDSDSIGGLLNQVIKQQLHSLNVYCQIKHQDFNQLLQELSEEFLLEYPGYIMQVHYLIQVFKSGHAFMSSTVEEDNDVNTNSYLLNFNRDSDIFISTFHEFTEAFRFIPNFNYFFARKILPKSVEVSKFLRQLFLAQQCLLVGLHRSGS